MTGDVRRLDERPAEPATIPPTRWSIVLRAGGSADSPEARQALRQLCETYWQTLYRFARKKGRPHDEALEAVQEFICRLLSGQRSLRLADPERGRFRSFLWTCFNAYLTDEYRAARRQKAGGGKRLYSFDSCGPDGYPLLAPVEHLTPENAFRKSIALDTFQNAFEELRAAWTERGKADAFRHLQAYLAEECRGSKARTLAQQLHVSESRARVQVSLLKKQFAEVLRRKIAESLSHPSRSEIDDELEWLWEALCL